MRQGNRSQTRKSGGNRQQSDKKESKAPSILPYPIDTGEKMLIPLRGAQRLPLSLSFVYEKMFSWEFVKESVQPADKKGEFFKRFQNCYRNEQKNQDSLREFWMRRRDFLESLRMQGYQVKEVRLRLIEPFVTGLGMEHVSETGFRLDRNTGLPFYPASSLKGALRSFVQEFAGEEIGINETTLFGSAEGGQGRLMVFDAFPENWPELRLDVMTPHYKDYYSSTEPPTDDQDPLPVSFMTVAEGSVFLFCFAIDSGKGESDETLEMVEQCLVACAGALGLGGKTAVGYGRFTQV